MSNAFYDGVQNEIRSGEIDWIKAKIRISFVRPEYNFDPKHKSLNQISSNLVVVTSDLVENKTILEGPNNLLIYDAEDVIVVYSGDKEVLVGGLVVHTNAGRLLGFMDYFYHPPTPFYMYPGLFYTVHWLNSGVRVMSVFKDAA